MTWFQNVDNDYIFVIAAVIHIIIIDRFVFKIWIVQF